MARREDLMEALDAIETGMCRVKEIFKPLNTGC